MNAEAMESGYILSAIPMSVMARFTVSSSGALSTVRRRAALTRTAAFPKMDRIAAKREKDRELIIVSSQNNSPVERSPSP